MRFWVNRQICGSDFDKSDVLLCDEGVGDFEGGWYTMSGLVVL